MRFYPRDDPGGYLVPAYVFGIMFTICCLGAIFTRDNGVSGFLIVCTIICAIITAVALYDYFEQRVLYRKSENDKTNREFKNLFND